MTHNDLITDAINTISHSHLINPEAFIQRDHPPDGAFAANTARLAHILATTNLTDSQIEEIFVGNPQDNDKRTLDVWELIRTRHISAVQAAREALSKQPKNTTTPKKIETAWKAISDSYKPIPDRDRTWHNNLTWWINCATEDGADPFLIMRTALGDYNTEHLVG